MCRLENGHKIPILKGDHLPELRERTLRVVQRTGEPTMVGIYDAQTRQLMEVYASDMKGV